MSKKAAALIETDEDTELTQEEIDEYRRRLVETRDEIVSRSQARVHEALDEATNQPDEFDRASGTVARNFSLRLVDKDRKLLKLVDRAIYKIDNDPLSFGYCEGTGEPIRRKRLEARPWARYSVEHKQFLEKERKLHGE